MNKCKKCGQTSLTAVCADCKIKYKTPKRKKKRCICCNKLLKNNQRKYCAECAEKAKQIQSRANSWKCKNKRDLIMIDIYISDIKFKTTKCDQDCKNCKYKDCIL